MGKCLVLNITLFKNLFLAISAQGKEVAVNIIPLPEGTVIFEDTSREKMKGKIIKTLKQNRRMSDPLGGRIQYESAKG